MLAEAAVSFTAQYRMAETARHLPPVAYALASDTLIGVVRARALALHHLDTTLAADAATPLAILGGLLLWLLRLALAPASTCPGSVGPGWRPAGR